MPNDSTIRVLHVVGGTDCGGTETWLTSMLRHAADYGLSMSFLVHTSARGYYDDLIESRGGRILRCLQHRSPLKYTTQLRQLLKQQRFDAIHSHVSSFSGLVMKVAFHSGIPVRIAHSHHTNPLRRPTLVRQCYQHAMHHWINTYATHRLAASQDATTTLAWPRLTSRSWEVLHCGIDLSRFAGPPDRTRTCRELGIKPSAIILGHLGRFIPAKNHIHLLETFAELARGNSRFHLLLVGDGPERPNIERVIATKNLGDKVTLAGVRTDAARLLTDVVDVFVFPSRREGLGLALVEAQAAGIPCVASTSIPQEAVLVPELVEQLPLEDGPIAWSRSVQTMQSARARITPQQAWQIVNESDFNLTTGLVRLRDTYRRGKTPVSRRERQVQDEASASR